MKDYSSLAKLGRDAGTEAMPVYLNNVLNKYDKILYAIVETRKQQLVQNPDVKITDIIKKRKTSNKPYEELY